MIYINLNIAVQPAAPLVSVAGLQQRDKGCLRRGGAGDVPLRPHFLLLLRRELARPCALLPAQEVDQGANPELASVPSP